MDFVVGLPRSPRGNNAIWVIMDRLTKRAYFITFRVGQSTEALAEKYMQEIVRLHGVPVRLFQIETLDLCHASEIVFRGA